ncbi:hypothetical protein Q9233_004058 [Columba guinea]|nr:hypothetical protein Q9233_004058 [Columba guinea]
MEEREGEVRWDGLCSRDAATRAAALDHIGQAVLRRSETISPVAAVPPPRAADGPLVPAARDGLNEVLARLLMLSKRCPFPDVREKSEAILSGVQGCWRGMAKAVCSSESRLLCAEDTPLVQTYPRSSFANVTCLVLSCVMKIVCLYVEILQ